jgi:hypothetical protein
MGKNNSIIKSIDKKFWEISDITYKEKCDLISFFYDCYYDTNQNTKDFAIEFYYLVNKILNGYIPLKLNNLIEYEEGLIDILSEHKKVIIVKVFYISIWDDDEIETSAKLNLLTGEITDIESVEIPNHYNSCSREFVRLPDGTEKDVNIIENEYFIEL